MTEPTLGQLATSVAALSALRDAVDGQLARERHALTNAMRDAHEALGVKSVTARLGAVDVGTVSWVTPKSAVCVDELARLSWVKRHHPLEVVETLRRSFETALMKGLVILDDGRVVHPETGELLTWAAPPSGAAGYPRTVFAPAGRAVLADAWRDGQLAYLVGQLSVTPQEALSWLPPDDGS